MNKIDIKAIILYSIAIILLYYVFNLLQITTIFIYLYHFIIPIIIGIFIHFILDPIIDYFSNQRLKRKYVVLLLFMTLLIIGILLLVYIIPIVTDSLTSLYNQITMQRIVISPLLSKLSSFLTSMNITSNVFKTFNTMTQSVISGLRYIIVGIGISFYLSYDDIHISDYIKKYVSHHHVIIDTINHLKIMTFKFIKSLFKDFIIFFILSFIIFLFIHPSLSLLLALILALTNLIPYIGPIIGGTPIIVYEYMQDPTLGLYTLLSIIILQYIESSYIQPYIFSKTVKIHPIFLILSLIFFSDIFGIVGMIFSPLLLIYVIELIKMIKKIYTSKIINH